MELLCDVGHVGSCFGSIGNRVSIGAREVHSFAWSVPLAQKSFWTHPMVLVGDEAKVESHFGPFGNSGNLDAR
jgi:hypothetical protein